MKTVFAGSTLGLVSLEGIEGDYAILTLSRAEGKCQVKYLFVKEELCQVAGKMIRSMGGTDLHRVCDVFGADLMVTQHSSGAGFWVWQWDRMEPVAVPFEVSRQELHDFAMAAFTELESPVV